MLGGVPSPATGTASPKREMEETAMNIMDDLQVKKEIQNDVGYVHADGIVDLTTMKPMRELPYSFVERATR